MYTEVRELVNFVCRYLFGRVPRRPTGIFAAELGNFLVAQFSSSWDINNPQNGENERILYINCGADGSSRCFDSCASEAGLPLADVLGNLPAQLRIFSNPGTVFMRVLDNGISIPVWDGEVDADDIYQPVPEHVVRIGSSRAEAFTNLGAAGKTVLVGKKSIPSSDLAVIELINNMYIPLGLEKCDEINSNLFHIQEKYPYLFVFKPSSSQTYTGVEFSQTRFGSSKSRPDLQTMLNIKQLSSQHATSCTSFSSPMNESMNYPHY